ncbi:MULTISPECIES: small ribosomal subunit biogenesis GTPase RsgA [unclassified Pseudomonas]|uniref:small ribosomal subunit biogenesis GTPase RsgA n=1 Tax=unclassified Pseudomonas TaxID=196821 RepID=UPI000BCBB2F6|nr:MULTISPECIES: small ribosomal subunit biogenesis GTPase RsgA [unclassified Pseudomonas]PVZ15470.1 ribosome biogenesis GTPase [Pseudomonas sp. URIL14HWK12:I12]PVZ24844.1 ribosome biogenesis GTPase [Pseudomonas sp. URIL14HWK12:I10]PVZ34690.1 ribosome biogenesis GTPase [Pseudomonas sp. URIL14HWK12:I11]SNZ08975.1 ribosome biogenesis GTPase [Pseudomonas sp. URIL14HWK12:I9]
MAKRQLTRRQAWRIDKIQNERAARATKRESQAQESLEGGDLGPEQHGLIIAHFGVQVEVEALEGEQAGSVFRCYLRANLPTLVTGDRVVWRAGHQSDGVIVAQLPRHSELCRPDARGQLKPVAGNVDQIVIVFAPAPEPHANLIDRYLVAAEHAGIRPLLLLNKADLIDEANGPGLHVLLKSYRELGYPLLEVSAHQGDGMKALKTRLDRHTSVFVGQSGVGKSSLVNSLLDVGTRVGELSHWSGQGQHTTTTARLYHFPEGGDLIDSPGIREFGLVHVSRDDVEAGFIEFAPLLGRCRFRDCNHDREPGCALLEALEAGRIQPQRMASYRSIIASLPKDEY